MNKVYIVTQGIHDDYRIIAVYSDPELAREHKLFLDSVQEYDEGSGIETWPISDGKDIGAGRHEWLVRWDRKTKTTLALFNAVTPKEIDSVITRCLGGLMEYVVAPDKETAIGIFREHFNQYRSTRSGRGEDAT